MNVKFQPKKDELEQKQIALIAMYSYTWLLMDTWLCKLVCEWKNG